jgi:hypothetical protein
MWLAREGHQQPSQRDQPRTRSCNRRRIRRTKPPTASREMVAGSETGASGISVIERMEPVIRSRCGVSPVLWLASTSQKAVGKLEGSGTSRAFDERAVPDESSSRTKKPPTESGVPPKLPA